jgi:alkylation response protein AidB-like acyl-CoA dehydrogenase
MDLNFTQEEEDFRATVRSWLKENTPDRTGMTDVEASRKWLKVLAAKGWLCASWPEEHGGPGWTLAQQYIFKEEKKALGVPDGGHGVTMIGPLIIDYGTEEQKKRFLPPIAAAEIVWCQGYSEPNAGSDLANLALRAELDGDTYVLNGQKTWTSGAMGSDWIFVLVRTDTTAKKKQRGISFVVMPIDTPGIERRPIRQITDEAHFCETFFTDVRVPIENRIGNENEGWLLGKHLLSYERIAVAADAYVGMINTLTRLAENTDMGDGAAIDNQVIRQKLAKLHMELDALAALGYRGMTARLRGKTLGSESSIIKLFGSELHQRASDLGMEISGPAGQVWESDSPEPLGRWSKTVAGSRSQSIFSGTSEIQRKIIAERVLGMPRG